MLCQRCQRHLRNCEGLKGGNCESKVRLRCISGSAKDLRSAGDRAYQWKCALCENSEMKIPLHNSTIKDDSVLLNAINSISEKFELINKIQLPKLSKELSHLKTVTDNIVNQNEQIMRKIDEYEGKSKTVKTVQKISSQTFRKRSVNLSVKSNADNDNNDNVPMLPLAEKSARFRPRRRSYVLNRMIHLLNKKLRKTSVSPRKRY